MTSKDAASPIGQPAANAAGGPTWRGNSARSGLSAGSDAAQRRRSSRNDWGTRHSSCDDGHVHARDPPASRARGGRGRRRPHCGARAGEASPPETRAPFCNRLAIGERDGLSSDPWSAHRGLRMCPTLVANDWWEEFRCFPPAPFWKHPQRSAAMSGDDSCRRQCRYWAFAQLSTARLYRARTRAECRGATRCASGTLRCAGAFHRS